LLWPDGTNCEDDGKDIFRKQLGQGLVTEASEFPTERPVSRPA
jgi:hypothetical protein